MDDEWKKILGQSIFAIALITAFLIKDILPTIEISGSVLMTIGIALLYGEHILRKVLKKGFGLTDEDLDEITQLKDDEEEDDDISIDTIAKPIDDPTPEPAVIDPPAPE